MNQTFNRVDNEVTVIIPTLNAGDKWDTFIKALKDQQLFDTLSPLGESIHHLQNPHQDRNSPVERSRSNVALEKSGSNVENIPLDFHVIVIDSGSTDDTVLKAKLAGFEVLSVLRQEFNHGGTRQKAFEHLIQKTTNSTTSQYVVLMTQDAVLASPHTLSWLLSAFNDESVGASYGRQLPNADASPLAAHARRYNYPDISRLTTLLDKDSLGIKAAFCSDSFAAYRVDALKKIGGFPKRVILGEDMWVAARLLQESYQVAYVSEACVYHSHNYSFWDEFRRYFDTGVFHREETWILREFGHIHGEGYRFVKSELAMVREVSLIRGIVLLLEISTRTLLKYLGYQMGKHHDFLPVSLKRKLGLFKHYWV